MESRDTQNGRGLAEMLQAETKKHIEYERGLMPVLLGCVQMALGAEVYFCDDTIRELQESEQWLAKQAKGNRRSQAIWRDVHPESQGPEESESEGERLAKETGLGDFGKQVLDKHGIRQPESVEAETADNEPLPESHGVRLVKAAVDDIEQALLALDPSAHREIIDKYLTERLPQIQADWEKEQERGKAENELLSDVIPKLPTESLVFLVGELKKAQALRKSA